MNLKIAVIIRAVAYSLLSVYSQSLCYYALT
jgi:hypothetical protein